MNQILLKARNLSKVYSNKKTSKKALSGVNFELFHGEVFSLLGVNGAGKTTLSSLLASLHPSTEGEILWQNRSIYDDLPAYRKIIGLCPQYQNLDPLLTLEQNLVFQGRYYGMAKNRLKERIEYLLSRFELEEYAKCKADELSGGYKQRFLIARALVHEPTLVILDEPTVGLDPQVRHKLWDYIRNFKKEGITVILTTHYLDEAEKLSNRVCVIDKGKIITIDTPENLKKEWKKGNLEEVFLHLLKGEDEV